MKENERNSNKGCSGCLWPLLVTILAIPVLMGDHGGATLPIIGPVYFVNPAPPDLVAHEECHDKRRLEIGDLAFYTDYILGGAQAEEDRCYAISNPIRYGARYP